MRQTRAGSYRCGGGCCKRDRDRQEGKLKPSKAKSTKGYKVHIEEVRNFVLRTSRSWITLSEIEQGLNLPNGYVRACLMDLNREGLVSRIMNREAHDGERDNVKVGGEGAGWAPSYVVNYQATES